MAGSEGPATNKRYRCKWCNGSGTVASGDKCVSCQGRGWYENPPPAGTATIGAVIAILVSLGLWWLGGPGWSTVLDGLALFFLGVAVVCLAIWLRGAEEEGQNALMLLGTLLAGSGLLSIPVLALFGN